MKKTGTAENIVWLMQNSNVTDAWRREAGDVVCYYAFTPDDKDEYHVFQNLIVQARGGSPEAADNLVGATKTVCLASEFSHVLKDGAWIVDLNTLIQQERPLTYQELLQ